MERAQADPNPSGWEKATRRSWLRRLSRILAPALAEPERGRRATAAGGELEADSSVQHAILRAVPAGETTIRRATENDVEAIARIHVETWRRGYRGQLPDAVIEFQSVEDRRQHWQRLLSQPTHDVLVAVRADTVLGFCSLIPSRDAGAPLDTAEIAALYVAPEHWRSGAGRQLMLASREVARQRGYRELTLWVLSSNQRGRAFYESMGMASDGAEKVEQRNGHPLRELRYRGSLDGD